MVCKLCLQERDLRNSHVFPELLHTTLYDHKHRALQLSVQGVKPQYIQKGIREPLLCGECEQLLSSSYEDYFARFWYQTAPLPNPANRGPYELSGYDYSRFKLFHLSILWRSGVASGRSFEHADLGPHEARLRAMVHDGNAGAPDEYPVFATVLVLPDTKTPCDGLVMPPIFVRDAGQRFYAMIYGGCVWQIAVGSPRIKPPFTTDMLTPSHLVLRVSDIDKFRPAANFFRATSLIT